MRFADFADLIEDGREVNGHYMTANNSETNAATFARLWDDIIWPEYLQPADHPLGNGWLWYGPRDSFTPLHHDLTNNLMAQFRGRKLVKLVAPFESAHIANHEHRYSLVDLDAPDLEAFPAMADVTIFETVIGRVTCCSSRRAGGTPFARSIVGDGHVPELRLGHRTLLALHDLRGDRLTREAPDNLSASVRSR